MSRITTFTNVEGRRLERTFAEQQSSRQGRPNGRNGGTGVYSSYLCVLHFIRLTLSISVVKFTAKKQGELDRGIPLVRVDTHSLR
jgi:hypothetical protein